MKKDKFKCPKFIIPLTKNELKILVFVLLSFLIGLLLMYLK